MSQHFSQKLVSGNSTATAISMPCIVHSLKPRRALQHGYTPPQMVIETCQDHMRSSPHVIQKALGSPLGQSMP